MSALNTIGTIGRVLGMMSGTLQRAKGPEVLHAGVAVFSNSVNPSTQAWVRVTFSRPRAGGTFRLRDVGESPTWTAPIAWDATGAEIASALDALSTRWQNVYLTTATLTILDLRNYMDPTITSWTPQIEVDLSSLT